MFSAMSRLQRRAEDNARRLRRIAGDPDRKPAGLIAREVGSLLRRGQSPRFYIERGLYREQSGSPGAYIADDEAEQMYALKKRGGGWLRSFEDKVRFDHLMRPSGLPLPQFLGHTRMGSYVSPAGDVRPLSTPDHLAAEVLAMVAASPTGNVFAKPVVANKGAGAVKLTAATLQERLGGLYHAVSHDDYVFQEAVRQHDGMSALHPDSLNTFRVLTGSGADGAAQVLCAVARMGSGGNAVDNSHAGGLFIGTDLDSGRLKKYAHQLFSYGGCRFDRHPDTGVRFEGYEVPLFAEAMDLARRAHEALPHPYAGWDVGITPDGPVVIEANASPHLLSLDVAYGGLKATPALRSFLDYHRIDYSAAGHARPLP